MSLSSQAPKSGRSTGGPLNWKARSADAPSSLVSKFQGGVLGILVHAVAVEACLPAHTRTSLARCLVDLQSNSVSKDLAFLMHHGQALKPRSALGWLAVGTLMTWALSVAALVCAVTLSISIAGLFLVGFLAVIGGSILAFTLGMMALCLALASFAAALVAGGGAALFTTLTAAKTSLSFVSSMFVPSPKPMKRRAEVHVSVPASPKLSIHVPAKTREKHEPATVSLPLHEPPSPAVKPVFVPEEAEDGEEPDTYIEPNFVRTNRGF